MNEIRTLRNTSSLLILLLVATPSHAQQPTLDAILQKLEANLNRYDTTIPSLFCDEHVVSQVFPGLPNQNTVTDSVFRLKHVPGPNQTFTLDESREVKTVNGKPATSQDTNAPATLSGAFEGALSVVSLSQRACINYTLQKTKPNTPYIIRFSSTLTPQNTADCLLQEEGKGRVVIDPATMQITHMELNTPHHKLSQEHSYDSPLIGDRAITVDYKPVVLDEQTFWMPSAITSQTTYARGTFHQITWSFKATYRNFHKLEVTSRLLPPTP